MSNEDYAAEAARIKRELKAKQDELEELRDDYAILVDEETKIAQIIVVCENTDYLTDCLESSIEHMETLASDDKVPGFESLFDFEEVSSYKSQMQITNGDYADGLKEVGTTIDNLKSEVANNIDAVSFEIHTLEVALSMYS